MKKVLVLIFVVTNVLCAQEKVEPTKDKEMKKYLIVTDIVANIRSKTIDPTTAYIQDLVQETQVFYNEPLVYKDETNGWYFVEAIEQQEYTHNKIWEGYPGWIRKKSVRFIDKLPDYNIVVKSPTAKIFVSSTDSAKVLLEVSIGTRFQSDKEKDGFYKVFLPDGKTGWIKKNNVNNINDKVTPEQLRENLLSTARSFLGVPYLWGGRSFLMPALLKSLNVITGVDCSGLVNLSHRANNIDLPRDAHEIWMVTEKISFTDLKPADLIFIAKKNKPESVGHVMMFIDEDMFIESPGTGLVVRICTFKTKFGKDIHELEKTGFDADGSKIYFGRIKELK